MGKELDTKKIRLHHTKADELAWKHQGLRLKLSVMDDIAWAYRYVGTDPDRVREGIKRELRKIEKHPAWQGRQEWP